MFDLQVVVDRSMSLAGSTPVQEAAARVLSALVSTCVTYFPVDHFAEFGTDVQLEEWVSRTSPGLAPSPTWHIPSAEEVRLAEQIVRKYVQGYSTSVTELCKCSNAKGEVRCSGERERLRQLLLGIEGVLIGARSCLPDFDTCADHGSDGMSLVLEGGIGTTLDFPNIRAELADALLLAYKWVNEHDSDSIKVC